MARKEDRYGITPFNGNDFGNWRFRLETILEEHGVLYCITEGKPSKQVEGQDFDKDDRKAKSILVQCVGDSHLEYVRDGKSAKEKFDKLLSTFERKGISSRLFLRKKLMLLKFKDNEPLQDFFLIFDETVRSLKAAGGNLEEDDVICYLLLSMPETYNVVVTAIETISSDKLNVNFVKGRLLDEEIKRLGTSSQIEEQSAAFEVRASKPIRCYACGELGHKKWSPKCKKRGNKKLFEAELVFENPDDNEDAVAFLVDSKNEDETITWCLDSGASDHLVNTDAYFTQFDKLHSPIVIGVAKAGQDLKAFKRGQIEVLVENTKKKIVIKNVLFVPNLRKNLLSASAITNGGLSIKLNHDEALVYGKNGLLFKGFKRGKLYEVEFKLMTKLNAYSICNNEQNMLWHRRFGHLGSESMFKLEKMVNGLKLDNNRNFSRSCVGCIQGKQTRQPFQGKHTQASKALALVHSDICGPISPESWNGKRYFVTFMDDFTHFLHVYPLTKKSDVFNTFKQYYALVTAKYGSSLQVLRCDNGGEYSSNQFKQFCSEKGIKLQYTIPYTPEQNGHSERMNRTITERARSMLADSNLPKSLWNEAVLMAAYLINRSPTSVLKDVTPAELWFDEKPNVSNLRIFGAVAHVHCPKQFRSKMDSKSKRCYMVGYAERAYRLWDPICKKVILARDIIFDEDSIFNIKDITIPIAVDNNLVNIDSKSDISSTGSDNVVNIDLKSDISSETKPLDTMPITEVDTGKRKKKQPIWMKDYDTSYFALALSAECFVNDVPQSYDDIEDRDDKDLWRHAMNEEIKSLMDNETWKLVEKPEKMKVVNNKWVFQIKHNAAGKKIKYKARLVAKGYSQRKGFDYNETYAPVANIITVRTLLAISIHKNYFLFQLDVKTAFLNGFLNEEIYMEQPEGFIQGVNLVCKLNKSIYGLKQASNCWNRRFNDFICKLGFKRSLSDSCLYIKVIKDIYIYLLIYVDDILIASNSEESIYELSETLNKEFKLSDQGEATYFLGINLIRENGNLKINQTGYLNKLLNKFSMTDSKPKTTPIEKNLIFQNSELTKKPFKELVGCLMYVMLHSRPDISVAVNYFSRCQSIATDAHFEQLKRILRYIKATLDLSLIYKQNNDANILQGYVDADYANDVADRKSTSGYLFQVYGSTVCWVTRKQATVSLSSTEAEYQSLASAVQECIWLRGLLEEMCILDIKDTTCLFEDNQSCIKFAEEPRRHHRMKHLDVKFNFIHEAISNKQVKLKFMESENQLADFLTKPLAYPVFNKMRFNIGLG